MSISSNVVIMTQDELIAYRNEWFQKGVERGRFEEGMDQSRAKATEGKAGMAGGQDPVRRSTAGTGLRVGVADAVQPATSEIMDATAGRDRQPPDRTADVTVENLTNFLNRYIGKVEAEDVAPAILDAFTVGRR